MFAAAHQKPETAHWASVDLLPIIGMIDCIFITIHTTFVVELRHVMRQQIVYVWKSVKRLLQQAAITHVYEAWSASSTVITFYDVLITAAAAGQVQ